MDDPSLVEEDYPRSVSVKRASSVGRFPRSIHRAAALIFKDASTAIRQFPTRENVFAVLDETTMEIQSFTVTKLGMAKYTCPCEEYR